MQLLLIRPFLLVAAALSARPFNHRALAIGILFPFACSTVAMAKAAVDISDITADDYFAATYYRRALDHPDVRRVASEDRRISLVSKDIGWSVRRLRTAIQKISGLGGDPKELATLAIRRNLEDARVKGRIVEVLLADDEPKHVVLYVKFRATSLKDVVKDAATIGAVVAKTTPLVSTLSLGGLHPRAANDAKTTVWSAKISRPSMQRIQTRRIEEYAERLYSGLFEGVESTPF